MIGPEFSPGLVDPRLVFPDLRARSRDGVLLEMAEGLGAAGVVAEPSELAERLRKREGDGCTGLAGGIAFPHCRVDRLPAPVLAVGVSASGVDFGASDGVPTTLFFLLLSPKDAPALHLQALARLTRLVRTPGLAGRLKEAGSAEAIARLLREAEAATFAATAP